MGGKEDEVDLEIEEEEREKDVHKSIGKSLDFFEQLAPFEVLAFHLDSSARYTKSNK